MTQNSNQVLDPEIAKGLASIGGELASIEEVTNLRTKTKDRACYRIGLTDGRTVKARRFASVEKQQAFINLSPALDGLPFNRVLSASGCVVIEEWIIGSAVQSHSLTTDDTRQLATVLARLNRKGIPSTVRTKTLQGVEWHAARLHNLLQNLVKKKKIESSLAAKLLKIAEAHQPKDFELGVIHTDFHPQNMIRCPNDEIWTIDNEGLRIGVLDFDLGRCLTRWSMTPTQRKTFYQGYAEVRSLAPFLENQIFWAINTLVLTTEINDNHGRSIDQFLARLSCFTENSKDGIWPVSRQ